MTAPIAETRQGNRTNLAAGSRAAMVWVLSVIVRLWVRTLRVDRISMKGILGHERAFPVVMLLWHNRGFSIPWLVRALSRGRPIYAMVSSSRDGATMGRFFRILGLRLVHGSSSRFGREALLDMITCLREGSDVALTPDGPRGPLYEIKAGAILAARRGHAGLLLIGVEFKNRWRLKSWDRYFIPKPFSRVTVKMELIAPDQVGRGSQAVEQVRRRLLELSGAVDEGANAREKTPTPASADVDAPAGN